MFPSFQLFTPQTLKNITILLLPLFIMIGCGGGESENIGGANETVDNTPPVITLLGEKEIILNKNEIFQDPGATALDDHDGDLSGSISVSSNLDTNKAGEYTITYSIQDKAGNSSNKKRVVLVIDTITPQPRPGLTINEVLVANTSTNIDPTTKQFSGWVELYNNTTSTINLNGYSLSDGNKEWNFPSISIARGSFLLIWTDGTDNGLHTNFGLDMDGESIILKNGTSIIDSITFGKQKSNISFTKQNDTLYYMTPTPASANTLASSVLVRSKKPDFTLKGTFYNSSQLLTLTQENGGTIYYTTDGSIPTKNSSIYTNPITINKNSVIRARALEKNKFISTVKNHSYFIKESVSLPVISLAINDEYMNDNTIGIYTEGTGVIPNYKYDWVRAGSIEYIKDGKLQFSENIGIRIHGQASRANAKKSFNIYAKDRFGPKSIDYKLFADKNIKKFKSIVLKNGGVDAFHHATMITNPIAHYIVKDNMEIDYVAYQPCVLFINGEYWGVYNIREKDNEDYIEANHGIDSSLVEYLRINGATTGRLTNPRSAAYEALIANVSDYNYLSSHMDIDEYINYIITQVFHSNTDWPANNTTAWREMSTNGKFRWTLNDTDNGFVRLDYDPLATLLDATSNGSRNPEWSTRLFRTLMQNSDFRQKFISRFTTHLNTTFAQSRIVNILDDMTTVIAPEMDRDFTRWPIAGNTFSWSAMRRGLVNFAENRTALMRNYLASDLSLSGDTTLTIPTTDKGFITVDGVKLSSTYNGHYFNNSRVLLKAIPNPGYTIDKWIINGSEQSGSSILLALTNDTTVEVVFIPFSGPKIVINEINLKSEKSFDTGDWVELYNNDTNAVDLSGWTLKDDSTTDNGFVFPNGTRLQAGQYLIVAKNKTKFQRLFPQISSLLGDLSFGISSKGDALHLYNQASARVDTVTFDADWIAAVGELVPGHTLSLDNPNNDNAQNNSWSFSHLHGTPGSAN